MGKTAFWQEKYLTFFRFGVKKRLTRTLYAVAKNPDVVWKIVVVALWQWSLKDIRNARRNPYITCLWYQTIKQSDRRDLAAVTRLS
jgi:hypothetical protein